MTIKLKYKKSAIFNPSIVAHIYENNFNLHALYVYKSLSVLEFSLVQNLKVNPYD